MTDRIQTHEPLRAQGAVEQIGGGLGCGGRFWRAIGRPVPAEVARRQLVGLEHAIALADRQYAGIKRQLQRPLRRLATGP